MAHIRKLPGGRWQARYRNPEDRREVAHNFKTKVAAQAWLDGVTASLERHDYADPRGGRVKVAEVAERWYATTATLKPSSRLSYRRLLDVHVLPRWRGVELRHVTTSGIAAWSADLAARRSASTTRKALIVLGQVLDMAVADRLIALNPARSSVVRVPPNTRREMRALTSAELEQLADAMPSERDRVLVLVLGWTGVRFGEAIALERGDVDTLRRRVRVSRAVAEVAGKTIVGTPKTHQARTVAMPPSVADVVGGYMGTLKGSLMFPNRDGGYMRPTWKRRIFDPAAAAANLTPPTLRVHDLRHTAASLWIASGASVKVIQQQLGHKTASMTLDVYSHLFPDELDAQAARLDALRSAAPADSVRTVPSDAEVIQLGHRL
jgi:integrase